MRPATAQLTSAHPGVAVPIHTCAITAAGEAQDKAARVDQAIAPSPSPLPLESSQDARSTANLPASLAPSAGETATGLQCLLREALGSEFAASLHAPQKLLPHLHALVCESPQAW